MSNFGINEEAAIRAFGQPYKEYVDAYNETLADLRIHGTLLREFIWKRDSGSKLKLQMIDAVVKGDVERVREKEKILNALIPKALGSAYNFFSLKLPVPDWTFNSSLLEVYVPPTAGSTISEEEELTPEDVTTTDIQGGAIMTDTQFITSLYQNILRREPDSAGLAYWIDDYVTSGRDQEWTLEEFIAAAQYHGEEIYSTTLPSVSLAGFPIWGWLVLGGIGLSIIGGKKSHGKRR